MHSNPASAASTSAPSQKGSQKGSQKPSGGGGSSAPKYRQVQPEEDLDVPTYNVVVMEYCDKVCGCGAWVRVCCREGQGLHGLSRDVDGWIAMQIMRLKVRLQSEQNSPTSFCHFIPSATCFMLSRRTGARSEGGMPTGCYRASWSRKNPTAPSLLCLLMLQPPGQHPIQAI